MAGTAPLDGWCSGGSSMNSTSPLEVVRARRVPHARARPTSPAGHPHLGGHDAGERRLAETGGRRRAVVAAGTPLAASSTMRGARRAGLTDELVECARPQARSSTPRRQGHHRVWRSAACRRCAALAPPERSASTSRRREAHRLPARVGESQSSSTRHRRGARRARRGSPRAVAELAERCTGVAAPSARRGGALNSWREVRQGQARFQVDQEAGAVLRRPGTDTTFEVVLEHSIES